MDFVFLLLIVFVCFLAGVLKCLLGFGMSMIMTPFFLIYYPPEVAVPIIVGLNLFANILIVLKD
ncbi:MAG: hypothetical protein KKD39_03805, partial [Candidatus Altiarchaeota archaeon]|nr:hypothetical protein [Candidatus Altiarchaeota archaeon]